MSAEKSRAVRQLHYDNSCKVILEFNKAFWTDRGIIGGSSITDLPVRQVHYPDKTQGSILLASYTWGEDSLRWTSLGLDDQIRVALKNLAILHGLEEEGTAFERRCVGGISHSWADNEFTSGAFAMFEPSQPHKLFKHIWRSEGRSHYCGEHTSTKHGWIEGAIESGLRVAYEICSRLQEDKDLTKDDVVPPLL